MCINILRSTDTDLDIVKLFFYRVCQFTQQQCTDHTDFWAFGHFFNINIDNHVLSTYIPTYLHTYAHIW